MMALSDYWSLPPRAALRRIGLDALHLSRLAALRRRSAGTGVIFYGHRICPPSTQPFQPNRGLECSPDFMARLLERLAELGLPVLALKDALGRLAHGDRTPFACFTFDDGYRDNLDYALPVFARFGAPFTVFLTSGFLDRTATMWWAVIEEVVRASDAVVDPATAHLIPSRTLYQKRRAFVRLLRLFLPAPARDREIWVRALTREHPGVLERCGNLPLDWDQARQLAASGLVGFGGHTVTHPMLSTLSESQYWDETETACVRMEQELGSRPTVMAYPYGDPAAVGEREFALAARHGFSAAVTTREHPLSPQSWAHPLALPRIALDGCQLAFRYLEPHLPRSH